MTEVHPPLDESDVGDRDEADRGPDPTAPPENLGPTIEEGMARLMAEGEQFAWIRHRLAIERAKAERDVPPLLKGWKNL